MNQCENFDIQHFKNPPSECYPIFAWIWNSRVDKKEIKEQITDFCANGVKGFYILPIPDNFRKDAGLRTHFDTTYLSDEYFTLVAYAADIAESLGMIMWLYDEGGWPSGGACGKVIEAYPDAILKKIIKVDLTDGKMQPGVVAMFDKDNNRTYDIKQAFTGYCIDKTYNANFVNLLDENVTKEFIKCTHERYKKYLGKHFGKTVKLIFTDEPRLTFPAWTDGLDKIFEEKYGYDLFDFLPYICEISECTNEKQIKAKIDYMHLCTELYERCYLEPLQKWCHENGILFGGHLGGENNTKTMIKCGYGCLTSELSKMDVPGVDTIWHQIFPNQDGSATLDDVTTRFFPRYASSAAHIGGKQIALSETFSVYGTGMTQEDMRYVINYQLIRGINTFNFMSLTSGRDRALMYGMRPHFLPQKPGWNGIIKVLDETARLCYLSRCGHSGVHSALYFPKDDLIIGGKIGATASESYNQLGEMLENLHIEFDIISDCEIENAEIVGDCLYIGNAVYDTVYVPKCMYMSVTTQKKLGGVCVKTDVQSLNHETVCDEKLRIMSRNFGDEKLVFVFNERTEAITYVLRQEETKYIYELDTSFGFITKYSCEENKITIQSGKTLVFLLSSKEYPVNNLLPIQIVSIDAPAIGMATRFIIDEGKICNKNVPGSDFELDKTSGSIIINYNYKLPEKLCGNLVLLQTDIRDYSVSVCINGKKFGAMSDYPKRLYLPVSEFLPSGHIELKIENTEACEIVNKSDDLLRDFAAEMRMYHNGKVNPHANSLKYESEYVSRLSKFNISDICLRVSICSPRSDNE